MGAQVETMVLPDQGVEAKGNELQKPLGDGGAQDKDFIRSPTGLDGDQRLFAQRGFLVTIGGGTARMARQLLGPEAKAKGADESF
mgnify:CR=1 FL=1